MTTKKVALGIVAIFAIIFILMTFAAPVSAAGGCTIDGLTYVGFYTGETKTLTYTIYSDEALWYTISVTWSPDAGGYSATINLGPPPRIYVGASQTKTFTITVTAPSTPNVKRIMIVTGTSDAYNGTMYTNVDSMSTTLYTPEFMIGVPIVSSCGLLVYLMIKRRFTQR